MDPLTILAALPTALDAIARATALAQKLGEAIKAGRGNDAVTPEDLAELERLSNLTSDEIHRRAGVTPPTGADETRDADRG